MVPTCLGYRILGLWSIDELQEAYDLKAKGRPYQAIAMILGVAVPGRTCQQVREAIGDCQKTIQ